MPRRGRVLLQLGFDACTRFWNFCGLFLARPENEGIGAVGLRRVEAIASGRLDRADVGQNGRPGPLLPLEPIT